MDDSIRTAKYYAPNYTALPTRQCLVCETPENYSASVVDAGIPWLCDRCRNTLLKLIKDFNATSNASNALNALEQENKEGKEEVTDTNVGKWIPVTEQI